MKSKQHNEDFPVLSFFSGGGFLDMGFEQAGFPIVWTNEYDVSFAKMHSSGITSWRKSRGNGIKAEIFNVNPIQDLSPRQILKQAFGNQKPLKFGVIGGPPCQDFSSAGNNDGFEGERGKLTKLYFDYILVMKPTFFVFENVRNLVNNKKHKTAFDKILKTVAEDYYIDMKVLNAIDFGVPQDRYRLFVVGIKREKKITLLETQFNFPWPTNKKYKDALRKYKWPGVSKFQNGVIAPEGIPKELYINSYLLTEEEESLIPNGDEYFLPYSDKFWQIGEGDTRNRSFKRLHRYKYSPTACYGNNEVHLHPFLPRRLSVREALRIQTVPDSYVLPKEIGLTQKFKMIGNGVPVKLAFVVASRLIDFLRKMSNHVTI